MNEYQRRCEKNLDKHEGKEPWSWSHITPARLYLKRSPTGSIFRLQKASLVGARNSRPATIRIALFWHRKILSKREDSALPHTQIPYVKCDWKIEKYRDKRIRLLHLIRPSLYSIPIALFNFLRSSNMWCFHNNLFSRITPRYLIWGIQKF